LNSLIGFRIKFQKRKIRRRRRRRKNLLIEFEAILFAHVQFESESFDKITFILSI
jgi:hypothetical protein